MKSLLKNVLVILLIGLAFFITINLVADCKNFIEEIEIPLYCAQESIGYEDMGANLMILKANMNEAGITDDYQGGIFVSSANDPYVYHKAIDRALNKLNRIRKIPRDEFSYQAGLLESRLLISDLPNPVLPWFLAQNWLLCLSGVVTFLTILTLWSL